MPTSSENQNNNPSEFLPDNDPKISKPLTNPVRGVTYGLTYTPNEANRSVLSPTNLEFDQTTPIRTLSNGYQSRVDGITDFTVYNDYIHYASPAISALGGPRRLNVYGQLVKATFRFEIYSRQYRT